MSTITLQEARTMLPDLLHHLMPGDEVRIIEDGRIVGRLLPGESSPVKPTRALGSTIAASVAHTAPHSETASRLRPPPGLGKGYITLVSNDDDHLADFADYMP
jgi:antitoxin (DNA-binding transcriptional repressor) of toxin-antitoxin stability system